MITFKCAHHGNSKCCGGSERKCLSRKGQTPLLPCVFGWRNMNMVSGRMRWAHDCCEDPSRSCHPDKPQTCITIRPDSTRPSPTPTSTIPTQPWSTNRHCVKKSPLPQTTTTANVRKSLHAQIALELYEIKRLQTDVTTDRSTPDHSMIRWKRRSDDWKALDNIEFCRVQHVQCRPSAA